AAIFRGPDGGSTEVVVPLERSLADYVDAIQTIAQKAAAVEKRSPEAVLHDFLQPRKDIVRYALAGQTPVCRSVDLLTGLALLAGARKSLLASAMSVKRPVKFHPRMSLSEAESFVAESRIGQTEAGSFVLVIETPHQVGAQLEIDGVPFGRRATQQL